MNLSILQIIAVVLLLVGLGFSAIRLFLGPTVPDRVAAADTLAVITTVALVGLAAWFDGLCQQPPYVRAVEKVVAEPQWPCIKASHCNQRLKEPNAS